MISRVVRRARWVMSHGSDGLPVEGEGGGEDEEKSSPSLSMGVQSHSTTSRILSSSFTNPSSEIPSSVNALDKVHLLVSFPLAVVAVAVPTLDVEVVPT
jgi:hypothetical protein